MTSRWSVRAAGGMCADKPMSNRPDRSPASHSSPPRSEPRRGSSSVPRFDPDLAFGLLLWAFILAGMALRLWSLDAMEFKADEFDHMVGAYRAAIDPWSAPLLVGEGTDVSPGVFYFQLLALPVSITQDPVWVARFIALLNVAAIPALFLLVRQFFTSRIALWATALFATSPWMIIFSRKIWNPDLVVPFLVVTLWCLFSAMRRYASWKAVAFAFALALLSQLHLSVWVALFPLLPLGLLFRPWGRPFALAGGVVTFIATFLVTLGTRTGQFLTAFTGPSATEPDLGMTLPQLAAYNVSWSIRVPSGFGFGSLLGHDGYASFAEHAVVPWTRPVFSLYVVLGAAGLALVMVRMVQSARRRSIDVPDRIVLTLLLMAVSAHALYIAFRVAAHPHYHVVLSLLPPILLALFLAWMSDHLRTVGALIARTLLIIVLAGDVWFGFSFLSFVRTRPDAIDGSYGKPYFVEQRRWSRGLEEAFLCIERRERTDARGVPADACRRMVP